MIPLGVGQKDVSQGDPAELALVLYLKPPEILKTKSKPLSASSLAQSAPIVGLPRKSVVRFMNPSSYDVTLVDGEINLTQH